MHVACTDGSEHPVVAEAQPHHHDRGEGRRGLRRPVRAPGQPDGVLDPAERARRASAKKAHYQGLALKSAIARRKKAQAQPLEQHPGVTQPLTAHRPAPDGSGRG